MIWTAGAVCLLLSLWSGFATHSFNEAIRYGQLARAQRSLDQLALTGAADFDAYRELGTLAARLGYGERALDAFDKSLRDRETPQALYGKGLVHYARGEHEQAIASFEALYRLAPAAAHPRAVLILADAYVEGGHEDRARALLRDALARGGSRPALKKRLEELESGP